LSTKKLQILGSFGSSDADTLDGMHADEFALTSDIEGLATETFVTNKIAEAQLDCINYKRELTSADSLDDIKENGIYFFNTGNVPANSPFQNASIVEVLGVPDAVNSQKFQRVSRYGTTETAYRGLSTTGWSDWGYHIISTDGVVPLSNGGTGASNAADARAKLGAAPAGYGLGEASTSITEAELDTTYVNGWYKLPDGATILGHTYDYCYMRVDAYNNTACTQTLYPISSTNITYQRNRAGGSWGDWTEVFNGNSVIPLSNGGTGATTGRGADCKINSDMNQSVSDVTDSTYMVFKYASPTDSGGTLYYRSADYVKDYITDALLGIGTKITDSSNLNNYTTPGKYYCGSGTNAATLTNAPMTSTGFGLIVVDGYIDGRVWQIALGTSGEIKIRYYSGSTWYGWYENLTNVLDDTTYGTSLPTAGTKGRVFFKKVSS